MEMKYTFFSPFIWRYALVNVIFFSMSMHVKSVLLLRECMSYCFGQYQLGTCFYFFNIRDRMALFPPYQKL